MEQWVVPSVSARKRYIGSKREWGISYTNAMAKNENDFPIVIIRWTGSYRIKVRSNRHERLSYSNSELEVSLQVGLFQAT